MVRHHHNLLKEGAISGGAGGLAVALWFLVLDILAGRPLRTPSILGQVILFQQSTPTEEVVIGAVVSYTLLHFGVFLLMGILITKLVHLAVTLAVFRFALLMLFVVFEVFFFGITYIFFTQTHGLFPWWEVLVADTLAVIVMVTYLWKRHPGLKRALAHEEALGA